MTTVYHCASEHVLDAHDAQVPLCAMSPLILDVLKHSAHDHAIKKAFLKVAPQ